jgi:hypothetical protein
MDVASNGTQARRCQGCGRAPGSIVSVHRGPNKPPGGEQVSELVQVQLLDHGPRLFCIRCRSLARKAIKRVTQKGLTVGKVRTAIAWSAPVSREDGR